MKTENTTVDSLLTQQKDQILRDWMRDVGQTGDIQEAQALLAAVHEAIRADADPEQLDSPALDKARNVLRSLSRECAAQGSTAGEASQFRSSSSSPRRWSSSATACWPCP
jgi:hypothetical protein